MQNPFRHIVSLLLVSGLAADPALASAACTISNPVPIIQAPSFQNRLTEEALSVPSEWPHFSNPLGLALRRKIGHAAVSNAPLGLIRFSIPGTVAQVGTFLLWLGIPYGERL